MKVYVVTSGCYSDYRIEDVFINKEKAEEFIKWYNDCTIEEYDTSDDIPIKREYRIRVNLEWGTNGSEKTSARIYKDSTPNDYDANYQLYLDNGRSKEVIIGRTIRAENYENHCEEYWKNRYIKVAHDFKSIAQYLKSEGLTKRQIDNYFHSGGLEKLE